VDVRGRGGRGGRGRRAICASVDDATRWERRRNGAGTCRGPAAHSRRWSGDGSRDEQSPPSGNCVPAMRARRPRVNSDSTPSFRHRPDALLGCTFDKRKTACSWIKYNTYLYGYVYKSFTWASNHAQSLLPVSPSTTSPMNSPARAHGMKYCRKRSVRPCAVHGTCSRLTLPLPVAASGEVAAYSCVSAPFAGGDATQPCTGHVSETQRAADCQSTHVNRAMNKVCMPPELAGDQTRMACRRHDPLLAQAPP
jgi:hypothetical protein